MGNLIEPSILNIEANASCQLKCPTCPTTEKGYPPVIGSGYLKIGDFINIIDSNPSIKEVYLECRGELFLNPDLLKILEHGHRKKIPLYSISGVNLNHVKEEVLKGVVKYCLRSLLCSIDGATDATYRTYRIGGDLSMVLANIRTINRFKKEYRSEFPALSWQFVVFGHNEHELAAARCMAKELGMSFVPKMSWDSDYSPIRNREMVMIETGWPAVTREEFARVASRQYTRNVCFSLWTGPRINWDGKVLGCCWNSWMDFGMNAFRDGFIKSINSERINYARAMLLGQRPFRDDLPCSTCELYLSNRESGDYLRLEEILPKEMPFWYGPLRTVYRSLGLNKLRGLIKG